MVRRPSPELLEIAREFVCVRVTNMAGVDLSTYVFDYDLTFAVLLMNADGHIYHQYGNRAPEAHDSHLSMTSLERVMRGTLEDHEAYVASDPPAREHRKPLSIEQMPHMARQIAAGKAPECFHCHMVNVSVDEAAIDEGTYEQSDVWRWPPSSRLGLRLDRDDQQLIAGVADASTAARAGIRVGDRLESLAGRTIRSEGDVQFVLEGVAADGATLPVRVERSGEEKSLTLKLASGWRAGAPEDLWRSSIWRMDPRPGFGGPILDADERRKAGVPDDAFGMRVQYLVTWGEHARIGRNARSAGLRPKDIVLSVGGKSDFRSPQHFHAWFRLTRKVGEKVPIEILRKGERETIELTVIE